MVEFFKQPSWEYQRRAAAINQWLFVAFIWIVSFDLGALAGAVVRRLT